MAKTVVTAKVEKKSSPVAAKKKAVRLPWTKQDITVLKKHSKSRTAVTDIAKELGRTPTALRQKAQTLGISLGTNRR